MRIADSGSGPEWKRWVCVCVRARPRALVCENTVRIMEQLPQLSQFPNLFTVLKIRFYRYVSYLAFWLKNIYHFLSLPETGVC